MLSAVLLSVTFLATPPDPLALYREGKPQQADLAVLAWRILKRAEQDPETHRVILRNAGKILETLERCEVRVVSYLGRRIDVGSNVQILDAVPGEYNRVLEESEPQVQVRGRLARRAIVTIGAGTPASTPASDPTHNPI